MTLKRMCGTYPVPGDHPSQATSRCDSTSMGDRRNHMGGRFSKTVETPGSVKWLTVHPSGLKLYMKKTNQFFSDLP